MRNLSLLKQAISNLTRCISLPAPESPETFFLDHNNSLSDRESTFLELNRFLDNLYFDPIRNRVLLRNINKNKASQELMECIRMFGDFINTFKDRNTLNIQGHINATRTTTSEESTQDDQRDFTEEQKEAAKAFRVTCNYIKEQLVAPIFKKHYDIEYPSEELAESPSDQITYDNRTPFPSRNSGVLSFYERIFNRMGLHFRRFSPTKISDNQIHVFDGHGSKTKHLTDEYEIKERLDGGDILLVSCYQNTSKAIDLLRKLTDIGKRSSRRSSGIIHLRNEGVIYSVPTTHGAIYTSQGRYHNNTPLDNICFVRTTLEDTNQPVNNKSYTTKTGQRVHLQRSKSHRRLYLGSDENYFEDRFKLLKQHYEDRMAAYKRVDPNSDLYDLSIDFDHLKRLNLTEQEFYRLNSLIDNQEDFRFLSRATRNEVGDQLNVCSIMTLLKINVRGEGITRDKRVENINYIKNLLTDLIQKEELIDNKLKENLEKLVCYVHSNLFIDNWANKSNLDRYLLLFNSSATASQLLNITKTATTDDYETVKELQHAIDCLRKDIYYNTPNYINTILDNVYEQLDQKMKTIEERIDNELKGNIEKLTEYINSDAFTQSCPNKSDLDRYRILSGSFFTSEIVANDINSFEHAVNSFKKATSQFNPEHINTILDNISINIRQKVRITTERKSEQKEQSRRSQRSPRRAR